MLHLRTKYRVTIDVMLDHARRFHDALAELMKDNADQPGPFCGTFLGAPWQFGIPVDRFKVPRSYGFIVLR